jgi:hypothetical protein
MKDINTLIKKVLNKNHLYDYSYEAVYQPDCDVYSISFMDGNGVVCFEVFLNKSDLIHPDELIKEIQIEINKTKPYEFDNIASP